MPEQGINYYEKFPEISQEMSVQAIRQALEKSKKKADVLTNRGDPKGPKLRKLVEAALEVFRDEASKQEYDRKLAESRQEPPKEDPRREELENLKKRAQDYLDNGENDLAKLAIERALALDMDCRDANLYNLAAIIYDKNGDYETAIQYINKALLEREEPEYIINKADICFHKAEVIAKHPHFQSSPQLQEEYRSIRARGLKLLDTACDKWHGDDHYRQFEREAMGLQAYELYFHPDKTDKEKAAQEKNAGLNKAKQCPCSNAAQDVLAEENRRKSEQNKWARLAREHRDKKEYTQARSAINQALSVDVVERSANLYWLVAAIYYEGDIDNDIALKYINMALELEPDNIYYIVLEGLIYGSKALQITRNIQFLSSPGLRKEYAEFRRLELETLWKAYFKADEACTKTDDNKHREQLAYALGQRAYALYFRANRLYVESGRNEEIGGLDCALEAERIAPGVSKWAQRVLQTVEAEEERRKAEEARKKAEAQERKAKQERNQRERTTLEKQAEEYFNRGNYNQAVNAVLRALGLDVSDRSDDYYLYRLAALSYFNSGGDKNTALDYADKALKLKPDDVYALVLKGLIYSRRALRTQSYSQRMEALQNFGLARVAAEKAYTREDNSANRKQYAYALGHVAHALYFDSYIVEMRRREFPTKDEKWLFIETGKTGLDKFLEKKEKKRSKDLVTPGIEDALLAEKIAPGASKEASEVLRDCKARGLLSFWGRLF